MKENGFPLKKKTKKTKHKIPIDADYANDHALLANTSAQDKSLLYSQEQALRDIGCCVNSDMDFICFN